MAQAGFAVAASSWAVLMGIAPILQIRRMLRERSSREVSLGYFAILLIGFLLWIAYGVAARNPALIIPNSVALLVGTALMIVAVRLRHRPGNDHRREPPVSPRTSGDLAAGARRDRPASGSDRGGGFRSDPSPNLES